MAASIASPAWSPPPRVLDAPATERCPSSRTVDHASRARVSELVDATRPRTSGRRVSPSYGLAFGDVEPQRRCSAACVVLVFAAGCPDRPIAQPGRPGSAPHVPHVHDARLRDRRVASSASAPTSDLLRDSSRQRVEDGPPVDDEVSDVEVAQPAPCDGRRQELSSDADPCSDRRQHDRCGRSLLAQPSQQLGVIGVDDRDGAGDRRDGGDAEPRIAVDERSHDDGERRLPRPRGAARMTRLSVVCQPAIRHRWTGSGSSRSRGVRSGPLNRPARGGVRRRRASRVRTLLARWTFTVMRELQLSTRPNVSASWSSSVTRVSSAGGRWAGSRRSHTPHTCRPASPTSSSTRDRFAAVADRVLDLRDRVQPDPPHHSRAALPRRQREPNACEPTRRRQHGDVERARCRSGDRCEIRARALDDVAGRTSSITRRADFGWLVVGAFEPGSRRAAHPRATSRPRMRTPRRSRGPSRGR